MQEEKGGTIVTFIVKSDPLGQKLFELTDKKTKM